MAVHHVCLICYREIPHAGAACPHCRARVSSTVGATPQMLVGLFVVMVLFFVGTGLRTGPFGGSGNNVQPSTTTPRTRPCRWVPALRRCWGACST